MLELSDTPRTDAHGKKCVLSGNMRLAAYFPDSGITKAGGFIGEMIHKKSFPSVPPRNFGRLSMELKSKLQSLRQGSAALLAGGELPPKRGAFAEARIQGLALSLLKAFWKSVNQIRQSNGRFPSVRSPSMNNATACEVAAFHVMASPLFVYQLASCSNVCLQCQGLLWRERRHRHIWWHRNDNCFIFEDGSPLHFP